MKIAPPRLPITIALTPAQNPSPKAEYASAPV